MYFLVAAHKPNLTKNYVESIALESILPDDKFRSDQISHTKPDSVAKPVCNDQPWDPKLVAFVDRWSLF